IEEMLDRFLMGHSRERRHLPVHLRRKGTGQREKRTVYLVDAVIPASTVRDHVGGERSKPFESVRVGSGSHAEEELEAQQRRWGLQHHLLQARAFAGFRGIGLQGSWLLH